MKKYEMKKSDLDALEQKVQVKEGLNQFKVSMLAAAITSLICTSVPTYAADLEIYKVPEDSVGATTLMMMLDLSGSMGWGYGYTNWGQSYTSMSIEEDYGVCSGTNTGVQLDTTTTSYYSRYYCAVPANTTNQKVTGYWSPSAADANRKWVAGCEKQANNSYRCYDRLTRLKDGLRQVLEGTATVPKIDDKIIIGLSTFAGSNGYIRVPARALNAATGDTKEVLVTKTRTVYDTVPIYETRQVQYEITAAVPGVPEYDRPYWQERARTANGSRDRYRTCDWNASTRQCTWNDTWRNISNKPSDVNTNGKTSRICSTDFKCQEWYILVPAVPPRPAVMGTKDVDVQVGTQQVPREETYQEWETQDVNQRELLLNTLRNLNASGGTPTPYAYAEAAAYLLGTNTRVDSYRVYDYYQALGNSNSSNTDKKKCRTPLEPNSYNEYTDDSGKKIIIRGCDTRDDSGWVLPATYVSYSSGWRRLYYNSNELLQRLESALAYSGWDSSTDDSKTNPITSAINYEAPTSITSQATNANKKECSGQGIYFLTDGQPQPGGYAVSTEDGKSGTAYALMSKALGTTKGADFSCSASPLGKRTAYDRAENGWACVGKFAQALLDPAKNPANVKIQTAVVGFGSSFGAGGTETDDVKDAKDWGVVGDGGWISGSSPEDVSKSINEFIDKLNKDVPSMSTGSSTIPMDALNPEVIQPFAYFPQFEPKVNPADKQQLWFGNLKKYYVVDGGVYSNVSGGSANTVVLKSKLQDLTDIWAKSGVDYSENTPIYKKGGVLSQLKLGTVTNLNADGESVTTAGRRLFTEYSFDGTEEEGKQVSRNFDLKQINYDYTTNSETKTDSSARVRGLMSLLGYSIADTTDTSDLDLSTTTATLRQMGSIYHSLPVLLTQEGMAVATRNATTKQVEISSIGRKDYVMFGTTQGLLSVVDASTGVEKFSFVPKEMIENQYETFRENAGSLAGGKNALYYGIDGEWTAHTVYVTKSDGTLTVNGAVRNVIGGTKEDVENLNGKQWVYGGLRMGGRSYYSLDFTDIDSPKLKFHIDPTTGKVYSKANASGKAYKAIENMAQSWSKPKLDYVNWKGQRKLVMFVGGGYDAGGDNGDGLFVNGVRTGYDGYEKYNYKQGDGKKGSGVYMFDADNGDLLWYADSAASTSDTDVMHASNGNLKYSVASDIKTIDRNNDGIVDHIYFGDLAGQAFRVDFKNDGDDTLFSSQVTQILDLHKSDGTSPRFYNSPVFTAHHSAGKKEGANIVVVSFVSGNKSSPLLATADSPAETGKKDPLDLQYDAVYAVYEYDIHPDGTFYPQSHIGARTLATEDSNTASTSQLKYIDNENVVRSDSTDALVLGANANSSSGWGGWYYPFKKKFSSTLENRGDAGASIIKGLTPLIAMEGSLYVTQYDASNNGTSSSCGAGVKGHSFTQRLCLPTGVCPENANFVYNLGAGIVNLNVGPYGNFGKKSIVVPDPADIGVGCVGDDCEAGKKFITAGGSIRFIPNRWFERYAKAD